MISKDTLSAILPDIKIYTYNSIDSTNNEAKRQIALGNQAPSLYIAREQTAGRGRLGRSFYSPKDTGLYMSLCVPVFWKMADTVSLTSAAAVAVTEAIEELTPCRVQIKWVNDIYLDGKKICGILTEAISASPLFLVFGIGINLSTKVFPKDIEQCATSLNLVLNETVLVSSIIRRLMTYIRQNEIRSFLDSYRSHSLVLGQSITYVKNDHLMEGVVLAINDDCSLLIRTRDGQKDVLSGGEITLRLAQ